MNNGGKRMEEELVLRLVVTLLNCLCVWTCTTKHIGWPKLCPFIGGTNRSIRPCRKSLVVYNVSTLSSGPTHEVEDH